MMSGAQTLPTEATSEPASTEIGIDRPTTHQSPTTALRQKATIFPADYRPEGITFSHVPQEIQRRVEVALPQEGKALLAHLLRFATMKPWHTLPDTWAALTAEGDNNERRAWVLVPSISALAHLPDAPCGSDRYAHLLIALEALHMLRRRVRRIQQTPACYVTVLSLCLDPLVTPLSSALQSCQKMEQAYANRRVKRLLAQVRERLQQRWKPEEPELLHLLAQMQQFAERYQEQGMPQAPLLSLLIQRRTRHAIRAS